MTQPVKRKRGRPKKIAVQPTALYKKVSFQPIVLFVSLTGESEVDTDLQYFVLLADIIGDPRTYKEAMSRVE